jgi:hypothetical protein
MMKIAGAEPDKYQFVKGMDLQIRIRIHTCHGSATLLLSPLFSSDKFFFIEIYWRLL